MLSVITWTVNAIIVGLVFWLVPAQGKAGKALRAALIFLTLFGVAFITGRTLDIIVESAAFVVFLIAERVAPRIKYDFTNNHTTLNALYFAAQGAAWAVVLYGTEVYLFKAHKQTWGMQALGWPLWAQGLVMLLVLDFKQYVIHLAEHRFYALWRFHKVHHSATEMNVVAGWRTHVLENALVQALSTYLLIYAFNADMRAMALFYFAPNLVISGFGAHMNVDFPKRAGKLPWYAYIVATPTTHAFHHRIDSPMRGINLGEILMIWDVMFGSFVNPCKEPTPDVYGIPDTNFPQDRFFAQQAFSFRSQEAAAEAEETAPAPTA